MKAPAFEYHRPETLADVSELLGRLDNAKVLAGGQSLIAMLNMRYVLPDHVVDINRVPGLAGVVIEKDTLRVGAMTRQRDLENHAGVKARAPVFAEALRFTGHDQTRSRGTIGGSLCHLDPAAELPGLAALHDATLHVVGATGTRDVPFGRWVQGYMAPDLAPDELLAGITFPLWPEPSGEAFCEFARRHGDFAIAGAAARVALDARGCIARIAVALIGLGVAPHRLVRSEADLVGARPGEEVLATATAEIDRLDVMSDAQYSAAYRRKLAGVLTRQALARALARAPGGSDVRI